MKKQTRKKHVFSQDDVLHALSLIAGAMHRAQLSISDATKVHTHQFLATLRRVGIERDTLPHEPYLEEVQANAAYLLISRLETLFVRTESYLMVHQHYRKGISFYHPESQAMKQLDAAMQWKEIDPKTSLAQQMGKRAMQEEQNIHTRLNQHLDARRQIGVGMERFMWITQGDDRVRSSHASRNGQIFSWASGPHPGAEGGCRCRAAPVALTQVERERLMAVDPPIEPVYPIESLLLIGRIGGLSVAAARRGIAAITRRVREKLDRYHTERLFRRPKGVPKDWVRKPSKKRAGVKYIDPKNVHSYVRIERAKPNSSNLGQQVDYVRWQKNGRSLDKNGKAVDAESLESHIPIKDFKFKPELFR